MSCPDVTARLLNTSATDATTLSGDHTPSPSATTAPINSSAAQEFFSQLENVLLAIRSGIEMSYRNASDSSSCAYGDKIQDVCSASGSSHGNGSSHSRGESSECRYGSTLFARGRLGDQLQMLNYSINAFYDYDTVSNA